MFATVPQKVAQAARLRLDRDDDHGAEGVAENVEKDAVDVHLRVGGRLLGLRLHLQMVQILFSSGKWKDSGRRTVCTEN